MVIDYWNWLELQSANKSIVGYKFKFRHQIDHIFLLYEKIFKHGPNEECQFASGFFLGMEHFQCHVKSEKGLIKLIS